MWKVNADVKTFTITEATLQSSTKNAGNKTDSKAIVAHLMKDAVLLSNFSRLRSNAGDTVKKEVALNLLEDMLLYVRVRTFSFVKDI